LLAERYATFEMPLRRITPRAVKAFSLADAADFRRRRQMIFAIDCLPPAFADAGLRFSPLLLFAAFHFD